MYIVWTCAIPTCRTMCIWIHVLALLMNGLFEKVTTSWSTIVLHLVNNELGELTAEYKWTDQVWEITTQNIIFSVLTTLPCLLPIFNSLTISMRYKHVTTFPTATSLIIYIYIYIFDILTNTKFKHVTSTYYHSWYLVFEFTINVT